LVDAPRHRFVARQTIAAHVVAIMLCEIAPAAHLHGDAPHPAVARIVVPEGNSTSYGSGTLVDVRDQFGLVVTNWHVVRDALGDVEVVFPDGFTSKARPLKVDADWDLAALVVWRPPVQSVTIAANAPQPGDQLTICGYGSGRYRTATGRCTRYYAPALDLPQHMVELDVEARQGDSGGPIFNQRGELAGVLFGAGGGTTLGSFGGRVGSFLATLAPNIGRAANDALVSADVAAPNGELAAVSHLDMASSRSTPAPLADLLKRADVNPSAAATHAADAHRAEEQPSSAMNLGGRFVSATDNGWRAVTASTTEAAPLASAPPTPTVNWFRHTKDVLAAVGVIAILVQVLRAAC